MGSERLNLKLRGSVRNLGIERNPSFAGFCKENLGIGQWEMGGKYGVLW